MPANATCPRTVAPFTGDVSAATGAVLSNVTVRVEYVTFPDGSVAANVTACVPSADFVVSSTALKVPLGDDATSVPSNLKRMTAVPLSSAAEADTVVVPLSTAPFDGDATLKTGGVVSALFNVTVQGAVENPMFPALSVAIICNV